MAGPGFRGIGRALAALRRWRRRDNAVKAQFSALCAGRGRLWGRLRGLPARLIPRVCKANLSETGVVRFENVGLRYGLGPEVLRDLTFRIEPHSFQFLTGPVRRRQDLAAAPAVPLAQADARADHPVRPRRRHAVEGRCGDAAPAHRHRVPGFPPARSHDDLRERRAAAARDGPARGQLPRRGGRAVELGRPRRAHVGAAAGALGRREAARGDRARGDRAAATAARRRADRQRRSELWRSGCCGCSSSSTNREPRW